MENRIFYTATIILCNIQTVVLGVLCIINNPRSSANFKWKAFTINYGS